MAINFTRTFTALGHLVGALDQLNTFRGSTLATRFDTIDNDHETAKQSLVSDLYATLEQTRDATDVYVSYLSALAAANVVAEVNLDRPMPGGGDLATALTELDRQMRAGGQSLDDSPTTVGHTPALTDGDPLILSTNLQGDGTTIQLSVPDSYLLTVPVGHSGGDTKYQETIRLVGLNDVVPPTDWNWPGGSGTNTTMLSADPAANVGLTNGVLNGLDGWTAVFGTWTAPVTAGPRALFGETQPLGVPTVVGDDTNISVLRQDVPTLVPRAVYSWTVFLKRTTAATDFRVSVSVTDSVTGLIVASNTVAGSALTLNTWVQFGGFFVTPEFLGNGQQRVQINFEGTGGTAPGHPNTSTVRVAHLALGRVEPVYKGGPSVVVWAGTKGLTTRDSCTLSVSATSGGLLHRGVDRLLDVRNVLPFGLPTASSPTISDSLVS